MQNMQEFLKIKHGYVQNVHIYFVVEAERLLGALFPAPKGLHASYPLPLEVPELKIWKSTATADILHGYHPFHKLTFYFFCYVPPSLDICIFLLA